MKRVQLVDLLNDLQRETEINKRIKENLDKAYDKPTRQQETWPTSIPSSVFVTTTTRGWRN